MTSPPTTSWDLLTSYQGGVLCGKVQDQAYSKNLVRTDHLDINDPIQVITQITVVSWNVLKVGWTLQIHARSATPKLCFGLGILWLAASRSDRSHLAFACLSHLIMRSNAVIKIMSKLTKKRRSSEGILCLQNYSPTQVQFSHFHFHFEERAEPQWSPSTIRKKRSAL